MKLSLRHIRAFSTTIKERVAQPTPPPKPKVVQSSLNLGSKLAQGELVLIVDENDEPQRSATRLEMRQNNLWHRSTSIFTVN